MSVLVGSQYFTTSPPVLMAPCAPIDPDRAGDTPCKRPPADRVLRVSLEEDPRLPGRNGSDRPLERIDKK